MEQQFLAVIIKKFQRWSAVALVSFLIFAISGVGGIVFQGIAWFDMSQKAGGLSYIGEAIFAEAPCDLCLKAQDMVSQKDNQQRQVKVDNLKISKLILNHGLSLLKPDFVLSPKLSFAAHKQWGLKEFISELYPPPPRLEV